MPSAHRARTAYLRVVARSGPDAEADLDPVDPAELLRVAAALVLVPRMGDEFLGSAVVVVCRMDRRGRADLIHAESGSRVSTTSRLPARLSSSGWSWPRRGAHVVARDGALGGDAAYTSKGDGPDLALVAQLAARLGVPVIAEGRIHTSTGWFAAAVAESTGTDEEPA